MNLQRRMLMNWELMLNVKREKQFKHIAFQGILHLRLNNSGIAISTNLDSPLVTTKSIMVCMVVSMLQLRST